MKSITEKEYREFVRQSNEIHDLIFEKVNMLALIQDGRLPKGYCDEIDFEEEDRKLVIHFEEYEHGCPYYETYYLPLEFLFDETYPEKYKLIWEEEVKRKEEERIRKEKEREEKEKQKCEIWERKEYERLKLKFEKKE